MSCYVGPNMSAVTSKKWRFSTSAYLIADSREELHSMALNLGLLKYWCHNGNHYDLTPNKRKQAIDQGAVVLPTLRDVGKKSLEIRRREAGG